MRYDVVLYTDGVRSGVWIGGFVERSVAEKYAGDANRMVAGRVMGVRAEYVVEEREATRRELGEKAKSVV